MTSQTFSRVRNDRGAHWPQALLWLASSLPVILLLALVLTIAFATTGANAAVPTTCNGSSLVERLKQNQPERYAEALKQAQATENGSGLLWKIEKDGQEPSFLFGTIHLTNPEVTEVSAKVQAALDATQTMVIETTGMLDPAKMQMALLGKPELTTFTDGSTLDKLLDENDLGTLKAGLEKRGIQLGLVSRMKPWLVMGMVALPDCEMANKQSGIEILDITLARQAEAEGKPVFGLEELTEQFDAMNSLPIDFQLNGLITTIKMGAMIPDIMATMTDLYLQGEIAQIMPILSAAAPAGLGEEADDYAEFEERIIRIRNHVMAERAVPIIDNGSAFIAIGALHLPGEEGVVALLQKSGYSVSRVD